MNDFCLLGGLCDFQKLFKSWLSEVASAAFYIRAFAFNRIKYPNKGQTEWMDRDVSNE